MADAKEPFDPKAYIGPVYGYYSTTDGKLLSMPFNSSTPVLYWNKELLSKAGLDPNKPPTTWPELGEMAKKAVAAGAKCGFTPQWQTWTMIENYGAWHNLPYATKANGFGGTDIELKFNDAAAREVHPDAGRLGQGQDLRLRRPRGQVDGAVHRRRLRLPHRLVGARPSAIDKALGTDKFGIAMMPYSPDVAPSRRTRSSAAPRCGCCRASPPPSTRASPSS